MFDDDALREILGDEEDPLLLPERTMPQMELPAAAVPQWGEMPGASSPSMSGGSDGFGLGPPPPFPGMAPMPGVVPGTMMPMPGMGAELALIEPTTTSPAAARRSAGFTAISAAAAISVGAYLGGAWGGGAGLAFSGSFWNLYRAQKWWKSQDPSERHEAVVSGVMGALSLAAGIYAAKKAYDRGADEGYDEE